MRGACEVWGHSRLSAAGTLTGLPQLVVVELEHLLEHLRLVLAAAKELVDHHPDPVVEGHRPDVLRPLEVRHPELSVSHSAPRAAALPALTDKF